MCNIALETKIADPIMIKMKSMTCCHVFSSDRFTVFNPASVIADTHKNRLSVNETLCAGVEDPQKMMAEMSPVAIKYK